MSARLAVRRFSFASALFGLAGAIAFAPGHVHAQTTTEACCKYPAVTCEDLAPATCMKQEGVPQGTDTTCATVTCPQCYTDSHCDDGIFCNGLETCDAGVCVAGVPPQCCDSPCAEYMPRCSADSPVAGLACSTDGDCREGRCERCQPACTTDADCNDGVACNGVETCVGNQCWPGVGTCCGNGVADVDAGEDCDGAQDERCPGQCGMPGETNGCRCPVFACGDGQYQASYELCEGGWNHGYACTDNAHCPGGTCVTRNEQCDGLDTGTCGPNVRCNPDCTCGLGVICGDGTTTPPYEECDINVPTTGCVAPSVCRADCTCSPVCGNNNIEQTEDCDGTDDDLCPGSCGAPGGDPADDCKCPPRVCGNGVLDLGEECEVDADCVCAPCRAPGDPLGECTCACTASSSPPPTPTWDCPGGNLGQTGCVARNRALTFRTVPPATADCEGGLSTAAIRVTMVDLQNPVPANSPCCPPPNFGAFEDATCTGDPAGPHSCSRWVGPPFTYLEAQDLPSLGNYRASRLQCTPYYHEWWNEPNVGTVNVIGAEILPSSTYVLKLYGSDCEGAEANCTNVSADVQMKTRRAGDIAPVFQDPAGSRTQPNAIDIVGAVNNFKKLSGAPKHIEAQVQPNLPDLNKDVDALDIGAIVNNLKASPAYPFSGPCRCPSTVPCNITGCSSDGACTGLYGSGALCVKTCAAGGPRAGQPCTSNKHCGLCVGGSRQGIPCDADSQCDTASGGTCSLGTCNVSGHCRDRCGRCN